MIRARSATNATTSADAVTAPKIRSIGTVPMRSASSPATMPPIGLMPQNVISKIESTRPRIRPGASAWSSAIVVVRKTIRTPASVAARAIESTSVLENASSETAVDATRTMMAIVRPRPAQRPNASIPNAPAITPIPVAADSSPNSAGPAPRRSRVTIGRITG